MTSTIMKKKGGMPDRLNESVILVASKKWGSTQRQPSRNLVDQYMLQDPDKSHG